MTKHHIYLCKYQIPNTKYQVPDDPRVFEQQLDDLGCCWTFGGSVRETRAEQECPGIKII